MLLLRGGVALALCLVVTGCSNNPYPLEEAQRPILYRGLPAEPQTLDPSVSYTSTEAQILAVIYSSYFQYHYLKLHPPTLELALGAVKPTRRPAPAWVVRGGKKVAKTGELWSFRLKPGLHYQDDPCFPGGKGREVVAADVLYSFKRMADPRVLSPALLFFEDRVVGLKEYRRRQQELINRGRPPDYRFPVEGLQADPGDRYSFRILLNQPYPPLRYLMAMSFTAPIPHEAVERYRSDFRRHPVGCGPFLLAQWTPGQRLVLRRNPNFRRELYPSEGETGDRKAGLLADAGKRLPLEEGVVYTVDRNSNAGWNLFLEGYLDDASVLQWNFRQVVSRQVTLTAKLAAQGIRLRRDHQPNIEYYAFNMRDPVVGGYTLRKRKLRQAISMAVGVRSELQQFYNDLGTPAQFLIPPGFFGYEKRYRNPYRHYDVMMARRLLAEAGYPNGIDRRTGERLSIFYDYAGRFSSGDPFLFFLSRQFNRIGIRLVPRPWPAEVWEGRRARELFQFTRYAWLADYPDPENFLFLLYGPNHWPGPNLSGYNNPEYNRLFEQMRGMEDGPQRLAIIRRMRALVVEDCPWVFQSHTETLTVHHDWLHNVKPQPISLDSAKYLRIDAGRRAHRRDLWYYRPFLIACALLLLALILTAVWISALVNAISAPNDAYFRMGTKAGWVLAIVLAGWPGAIAYLVWGRPWGTQPTSFPSAL
jgi:oligopeptide transport system substrate-binding protein